MNKEDEKLIRNFLQESENLTETTIELFWILPPLLYSKKLRKRKDIEEFVLTVLKMDFANYVYKSRATLVGRIMKKIHLMDIKDSVELRNNLVNFLKANIKREHIKKDKGESLDNFFSDWASLLKKND